MKKKRKRERNGLALSPTSTQSQDSHRPLTVSCPTYLSWTLMPVERKNNNWDGILKVSMFNSNNNKKFDWPRDLAQHTKHLVSTRSWVQSPVPKKEKKKWAWWAGDLAQRHSAWLASVRSWVCLPISKNKTKQNQVCFVSSFLVAGVGPLHFYFLFCSRNQTQGLVLTRQALCRELISPAPRLLHLACLSVIKVMLAISKTLSARNHIFSTGNSIVL